MYSPQSSAERASSACSAANSQRSGSAMSRPAPVATKPGQTCVIEIVGETLGDFQGVDVSVRDGHGAHLGHLPDRQLYGLLECNIVEVNGPDHAGVDTVRIRASSPAAAAFSRTGARSSAARRTRSARAAGAGPRRSAASRRQLPPARARSS